MEAILSELGMALTLDFTNLRFANRPGRNTGQFRAEVFRTALHISSVSY